MDSKLPALLLDLEVQFYFKIMYAYIRHSHFHTHSLYLFYDQVLIDETAHFDRERIPERVVHAKGSGIIYLFIQQIWQMTFFLVLSQFPVGPVGQYYLVC